MTALCSQTQTKENFKNFFGLGLIKERSKLIIINKPSSKPTNILQINTQIAVIRITEIDSSNSHYETDFGVSSAFGA